MTDDKPKPEPLDPEKDPGNINHVPPIEMPSEIPEQEGVEQAWAKTTHPCGFAGELRYVRGDLFRRLSGLRRDQYDPEEFNAMDNPYATQCPKCNDRFITEWSVLEPAVVRVRGDKSRRGRE